MYFLKLLLISTSEVDRYLTVPIIDFKTGDPYLWWSQHGQEFPILLKLDWHFLSAPATSVPSERLFSTAGNLHDDKRNRIMAELSEELLFIQNNLVLCMTSNNSGYVAMPQVLYMHGRFLLISRKRYSLYFGSAGVIGIETLTTIGYRNLNPSAWADQRNRKGG